MKSTAVLSAVAAALLGLAALAQAQGFERGPRHWEGGGRWGGEQRPMQAERQDGWRQQQGPPQRVYPRQQPYPQQVYPQGAYPAQPVPQRRGPPAAIPVPPQYGPMPQYAAPPQYVPPPAPHWNHARGFRPGDALPPEYRQRQFIVHDWRGHRLYAPPPGYVWIQPEPGSYLLIGNNGVIANMLVGQ